MSTAQLESAVARATGEARSTIRRRGFRLQQPLPDEPLDAVDCPSCGCPILVIWPRAAGQTPQLECHRCDATFERSPRDRVYPLRLSTLSLPPRRSYRPAA